MVFCLYGSMIYAQIDPPCDNDPGTITPPCDTNAVPIDANVVLLIIAAVLFGIYTIYNYNINKKRPA